MSVSRRQLTELAQLATEWREAIVATDRTRLGALRDFPATGCVSATSLLGEYVTRCGFTGVRYVSSERRELRGPRIHAWLEWRKIVVDITADQLDAMLPAVVVGRWSAWHLVGHRRESALGPLHGDHFHWFNLIDTTRRELRATR